MAEAALALSRRADAPHAQDPGHWLIGAGPARAGTGHRYAPLWRQRLVAARAHAGVAGLLGSIAAVSVLVLALCLALTAEAGAGLPVLLALGLPFLALCCSISALPSSAPS